MLDKADALSLALSGAADEAEDWLEDDEPAHATSQRSIQAQAEIEKILEDKNPQELRDLLADLVRSLPDVRQRVLETRKLASGGLDEPVARAGPFVMNTHSALEQAIDDYQSGRF